MKSIFNEEIKLPNQPIPSLPPPEICFLLGDLEHELSISIYIYIVVCVYMYLHVCVYIYRYTHIVIYVYLSIDRYVFAVHGDIAVMYTTGT